jgi:hypothetical protein
MIDLPDGFKDAVYSNTAFSFSFVDRLKILFGWQLDFTTQTLCEHSPGKTQPGYNKLHLLRPEWMKRRRDIGVAVEQRDR